MSAARSGLAFPEKMAMDASSGLSSSASHAATDPAAAAATAPNIKPLAHAELPNDSEPDAAAAARATVDAARTGARAARDSTERVAASILCCGTS